MESLSSESPDSNPLVHSMSFSGRLLERGFWLYVWKITDQNDRLALYVGRTGDSSSANAASPFNRIGQHLDFRPKAKGNAMARQLAAADMEPRWCFFEMVAIGPLFPEQKSFTAHCPFRDTLAALEMKCADYLKSRGYGVLGTHASKKKLDENLWNQVEIVLQPRFPCRSPHSERTD